VFPHRPSAVTSTPSLSGLQGYANMAHRTTHTNSCKFYYKFSGLLNKLKSGPDALIDRVFAASDADARQYGWRVTSTHGRFGREYRDPRFDKLTACTDCDGLGITATRISCGRCSGTGRIVIESAPGPRAGRISRGLT
jgi:hypothetical protein